MTAHLMKAVNVIDPVSCRPMRNRETGRLASIVVEMTKDETKAFEAERRDLAKDTRKDKDRKDK